jgi:hypothetical protein
VNINKKKLNVYIKTPSGCHDAAHFRFSKLWQKLRTVELPHKNHFKIGTPFTLYSVDQTISKNLH